MPKFVSCTGVQFYVDGGYIAPTDQYHIEISSTYTECRFPEEKRKVFDINLSLSELLDLINSLLDIVESKT